MKKQIIFGFIFLAFLFLTLQQVLAVETSNNCQKEGEMCGGIAGLICCDNLNCNYGENAGQPDASGICENITLEDRYLAIWENIFKEQNNINDEYFNSHIKIQSSEITQWNEGESLRVTYQVTIGWAIINVSDSILVKVSENSVLANLVTPNQYLEQSDVKKLIDNKVYSEITKINPLTSLKFEKYEDAVNAFKEEASQKIEVRSISFYVPGNVPRVDGNPYFIGFGVIDEAENKCIKGNFNLVTGEVKSWEDACIVTGNSGESKCAKEREMCGGIAGIVCCSDLNCDYGGMEGTPDAAGICVSSNSNPQKNETNKLIYWIIGIAVVLIIIVFLIIRKKK
jgi:hypothetical protein